MRTIKTIRTIRTTIAILFILFFPSCKREGRVTPTFEETRVVMGTFAKITVVGVNEARAKKGIDEAFKEIEKIDRLMSRFSDESELSRVNRLAGMRPVRVSEEILYVTKMSIYFAKITGGAFDPTILPLVELWGISKKKKTVPSREGIEKMRALVGYRHIMVDEKKSTVMLDIKDTGIDFGGIAKGYGVDRAVSSLKKNGISNAMVDIGRNVYMLGRSEDRDAWKIGVRHPRNEGENIAVLSLQDRAVATSGDYENFIEIKGKRYCHIIDPREGMPVEGILSVTIVADSAMEADALSTAVFVMGPESGMELIEGLEKVEGVIMFEIDSGKRDIRMIVSSGLEGRTGIK